MKKVLLFAFILGQLLVGKLAVAQNRQEHTLWGAWFHTQRFSKHWGGTFDVQMRSADDVKYLRNPLIRPGVTYFFNNQQSVTAGYLFTGTYNQTANTETFRREHRIWEQFIQTHKLFTNVALQHRLRLEQRFVGQLNAQEAYFSQRLRYFVRGIVPLKKDSTFSKGVFLALQNEVFVNVQNKDKVNGNFFDQNRVYIALGYRFSKRIDIETGYLNQYVNAAGPVNTNNNVWQVALYTRFGN